MTQLRTLTYVVQMDVSDGKEKAKDFRVTLKTMEQDADKASSAVDSLAKSIGEKYATNVKTSIDQTKTVRNEIKAAAREVTRSEKAYQQLTQEYKHLSERTGKTAKEQEILNAQYRLGRGATKEQREEIARVVTAYQEQREAAIQTQGSMRALRGQAQNLGYQLQDVAVQAQMGTDAFVIIGQQGSQLAAGFGATGALIGAGIAVGAAAIGVLNKAFADTRKLAEDARKGVISLADSIKELNTIGKGSQIDKIINADVALLKIRELDSQLINVGKQLSEAKKISDALVFTVDGEEFEKTASQLERDRAATALLQRQYDNLTKQISYYNKIRAGATAESVEADRRVKELIESLKLEIKFYGEDADEIERYALAKKGADAANLIELKRLQDLIKAKNDEAEATKKMSAEMANIGTTPIPTKFFDDFIKTRKNKLEDQYQEELDIAKQAKDLGIATEEEYQAKIAELTENYEQEVNKKTEAERRATREIDTLLKEQRKMQEDHINTLAKHTDEGKLIKLQIQYAKERELLAGNNAALLELDKHYNDERIKISGDFWEKYAVYAKENLESFDDQVANSLDRFTSGFGNAIADAVFDSDSLGEAMSNIFKDIGRSMVAFFAEWVAQKLMIWALDQTLNKTAGAQKATTMSMDAQAMSMNAGLNAFSSTAAIPIVGPFLAPAAAATAIAATQPMAAAVQSLSFAGVFDKGGMIPSGTAGIVAEYGDELVGGTMVYNGSQGSLGVTGREKTAKMTGGTSNTFNVNSYGNASPEAIARAISRTLKKGGKSIDNAVYDSMDRGRKNKGKRFNA